MPTFTAIAFDRLIEPGAEKSMVNGRSSPDSKLRRRRSLSNTTDIRRLNGIPRNPKMEGQDYAPPSPKMERGESIPPKLERGVSVPPKAELERGVSVPPRIKLERGVSVPSTTTLERGGFVQSRANLDRRNAAPAVEKESHWTQISPALYATPASTPLPDSPSQFSPSPYIINHKRRGPRLMKSFSEYDVANWKNEAQESKVGVDVSVAEVGVPSGCKDDISVPNKVLDSTPNHNIEHFVNGDVEEKHLSGVGGGKNGSIKTPSNGVVEQSKKSVNHNLQHVYVDGDSVDPQDSVSARSAAENEGSAGAERYLNSTTSFHEFYDAWEDLSTESGSQPPLPDIETELREIRLTLLMEIEQRKQAEENLNNLKSQWQRIHEQLSLVGLNLPANPAPLGEGEDPADPAEELFQQVYLARVVSNSIGRGVAKAEVEMEMEAQIEVKNSEIARLLDRLHYFEAVNQEMSQRNQEVVESARRLRQRRKRRHRWIWGSISAAVALGSAAVMYTYLQSGKGLSSDSPPRVSEIDRGSKK